MATLAVAFFLFAYGLRFSWWGLTAGFTFDDLMNLGRAIQFGWREALLDTVLFAKPSHLYRPAGALFYLSIDALAGPDPLAYRVACHALLAINTLIAFRLFHILSGQFAVAAIAAVPLVHHPSRQLFYVNSGYCYDLLCFAFTMAVLWVYVRERGRGRDVTGWGLAAVLFLLILALGSKEVAVALPVALLAYEASTPGRWTTRRAVPILAAGAVVALFVTGRVLADSGLASIASYTPSLAAPMLIKRSFAFLRECSLLPGWGGFALTLLAMLPRDRTAATGLTLAAAAFLPVAVLDRPFEASYVAAAGWSLAVANLLVWVTGRTAWARPDSTADAGWAGERVPAAAAWPLVPFILTASWFWSQSAKRALDPRDTLREGRRIALATADLRALRLDVRPPEQVLFIEDPFPESRFSSTFLLTILHRGPGGSREVIRADWVREGARDDPSRYAAVLTMRDGRIERIR